MRRICKKSMRGLAAFILFTVVCSVSALAVEAQVGTVTGDTLNLRASQSSESEILGSAKKDDLVVVLQKSDDWYQVVFDQTYGYMHKDYLTISANKDFNIGAGRITAVSVNFRTKPSTSSEIIRKFSNDEKVNVIGVESGWFKVVAGERTGYVHADYLTILTKSGEMPKSSTTASGKGNEIVAFAKTFLGCRYQYGASNGKTFDCSGFTHYVFKHFGYSLNRSAAGQLSNGTTVSSRANLQPGDLVFFRDPSINKAAASHAGIYVGDGKFIHCSSSGGGVKYNSLNDNYYNKYYIGGRRIVE